MPRQQHLPALGLIWLLALGALLPAPALAGAFDAGATGTLNLLGTSSANGAADLGIVIDLAPVVQISTGGGRATPTQNFPTLAATVSGTGDASATAGVAALITLTNNTNDTIDVFFEFVYSLIADTSRLASRGQGDANALVDLFVDGIVISGPESVSSTVIAGSASSVTTDRDDGTVNFTLRLLAAGTAVIDLTVDSDGQSVPVPPALALVALGLVGLGLQRRRRAARIW